MQKTAYEMRISDWSSDVCSSDLILASNIEDDPSNTTRFLVLGKQEPGQSGDDITSVVMTAHRNQPGALFKLLQPFAESGLDLTRLERSEEHTSELQSLMRNSYAVFCLNKKTHMMTRRHTNRI